ncbi:MAG: asparagine synthase (glutamine-hydrolyzing), partial [Candidatus Hermodarchaeota archaeon]
MCGICGFNFEDRSLAKKMCSLIKHRGPDDEGYYVDNNITIGMKRLSIIDLNTGHQPQHNEDGDIWIVFNGEIYNFIELRDELEKKGHTFYTKSDTESIIHAYEEWGNDCVKKLRGQFAFCIYDGKKNHFFLARDHLGLKPLYYYFNDTDFIFSSEIKCMFLYEINREVNKNALNLYFSLKYVPFDKTLFKKIYRLPSASYMIFNLNNKQISVKKYWNINFNSENHSSIDVLVNELKTLIEDSIKIRMISDVPLGAFLSGGIDSSGIVGVMSKLSERPIKTFSIGFEEGAPIDETKYAKLIADYYNTDHTELTIKSSSFKILPELVWHLDDLIADAAIIPVYFMAKYAKDKITVALTGDGADEVFAGYYWYFQNRRKIYTQHIPENILKKIMQLNHYLPSHKLRLFLSYLNELSGKDGSFYYSILTMPDSEKSELLVYNPENVIPIINSKLNNNLDKTTKYISWDLNYQLPNQYNMKIDKMTMAASLEARTPYLDCKLVSWSSSIPSHLKFNRNIEKYILRLAFKDIIPTEILKRKKQGFGTPIGFWLQTGLKEVSAEILEKLIKRSDLVRPKYLNLIKKNRFRELYMQRVWNLIMFELWYETFIENDGIKPIIL